MSQPPTGEHHTSRLPESSESPDFLVRRGEHGFYVEALTVFSGIVDERRHGAREAEVLDAIEGLEKGRFFLGVNFERVGSSSPRRTVMRRHLETWLAGLDPDKLEADAERGLPYPSTIIEAGDWVLDVAAFPIAREHRGAQDQPVIGIGPLMAGTVNDHEKIGAALRRKRSRYRQARKPLVLALLSMSTFFESQHVERLLFGTTAAYFSGSGLLTHQALVADGLWSEEGGSPGQHVSAALVGTMMSQTNFVSRWPTLWHNPWAERPLYVGLPFPEAGWNGEHAQLSETQTAPRDVLGLSPEWPGPDPRLADGVSERERRERL